MSGISTAEVQHSPPCILQLDTFSSDDCQLNTAFRNPDRKLAARCRPACAGCPIARACSSRRMKRPLRVGQSLV